MLTPKYYQTITNNRESYREYCVVSIYEIEKEEDVAFNLKSSTIGIILEQEIVGQIIDELPVLGNLVVHERHKNLSHLYFI